MIKTVLKILKIVFEKIFHKDEKREYKNSVHQESKFSLFTSQNQTNQIANISHEEIPEISCNFNGRSNGKSGKITIQIEKPKDGRTLILESVSLNDLSSEYSASFASLLYELPQDKSLNYSESFFTQKQDIDLKLIYRTMDNKRYKFMAKIGQEERQGDQFNLYLIAGSQKIEKLIS